MTHDLKDMADSTAKRIAGFVDDARDLVDELPVRKRRQSQRRSRLFGRLVLVAGTWFGVVMAYRAIRRRSASDEVVLDNSANGMGERLSHVDSSAV